MKFNVSVYNFFFLHEKYLHPAINFRLPLFLSFVYYVCNELYS